jgi:hypothetical protein
MRRLLPLALVVLLVAACGDDGDAVESSGTADPDTPVTSPPVSTLPTDDTLVGWARIEPTEDLVDPVVATPEELVPDEVDFNAVRIHFYGGVQDCYGARASAVETADEVRVTLEVGGQPEAGDRACIEIAEAQELLLVLDAPVGDRELIAETGPRG